MNRWRALLLLGSFELGCAASEPEQRPLSLPQSASVSASSEASNAKPERRLSIVGTNDLHGRVLALPLLAGYVANLRAARKSDGGAVLLLDGGDMYQGTLESNLLEGRPVRDAYASLGYAAVTVGNHEFDFGPAGPAATPQSATDDRRGALLALAKEAPFPFLSSNILDRASGARVDWPNIKPRVLVEAAGYKVALIGVSTAETLTTTIAPNVDDLTMKPLLAAVTEQAALARKEGAEVVVVLAHAGGKCKRFTGDSVSDECEQDAEIFDLARGLPPGTVHAIVAGHSHAGVAHEVNGIPIIEQFAYGSAFGRIDLKLADGTVKVERIFAPQELCPGAKQPDFDSCETPPYEGAPVVRDRSLRALLQPAIDASKARREEELGPTLTSEIKRAYDEESALGNLFADLMLAGVPGADVAFMNGGGLRAHLPQGKLRYGALFESFPFDNRIATVTLTVAELKSVLSSNLNKSGGILSVAGLEVTALCKQGALVLELRRAGKKPLLSDETALTVVGSDFLFLGGDGFWGDVRDKQVSVKSELMRDVMESQLKLRKTVDAATLFDSKKPRLRLPSVRPISCQKSK